MDSDTTEKIAVNAIKGSIFLTKKISHYINEYDKEPSWDGFPYIYNDNKKIKNKFNWEITCKS